MIDIDCKVIKNMVKKAFQLYLTIENYQRMQKEVGNISAWTENAYIDFLNSKTPITEEKVVVVEQKAKSLGEEADRLREELTNQQKYTILAAEQAKVSMANQERLSQIGYWYRKIDVLRKKHPQAVSSFSMALGYAKPELRPRTNPSDAEILYNYLNDNLRKKPIDFEETK